MARLTRVLVIDADPKGLQTLAFGFEREGCRVTSASSPEEGLSNLQGERPDGVVVALREGPGAVQFIREKLATDQGEPVGVLALGGEEHRRVVTDAHADFLPLPAFLRDIITATRVRAATRAVPPGKDSLLQGALSEYGLFFLMRTLLGLRASAVVLLERANRKGELRFAKGELRAAQVGTVTGAPALNQLLLWEEAAMEIRFRAVTARSQFNNKSAALMEDAERFLRDFTHTARNLGSAQTVYETAPTSHRAEPQMDVAPVLRLFDGERTIAEVLDESPFRVFDTLRIISRLVDTDVIQKKAGVVPRPLVSTSAASPLMEAWLRREVETVEPASPATIIASSAIGGKTGPLPMSAAPAPGSGLTQAPAAQAAPATASAQASHRQPAPASAPKPPTPAQPAAGFASTQVAPGQPAPAFAPKQAAPAQPLPSPSPQERPRQHVPTFASKQARTGAPVPTFASKQAGPGQKVSSSGPTDLATAEPTPPSTSAFPQASPGQPSASSHASDSSYASAFAQTPPVISRAAVNESPSFVKTPAFAQGSAMSPPIATQLPFAAPSTAAQPPPASSSMRAAGPAMVSRAPGPSSATHNPNPSPDASRRRRAVAPTTGGNTPLPAARGELVAKKPGLDKAIGPRPSMVIDLPAEVLEPVLIQPPPADTARHVSAVASAVEPHTLQPRTITPATAAAGASPTPATAAPGTLAGAANLTPRSSGSLAIRGPVDSSRRSNKGPMGSIEIDPSLLAEMDAAQPAADKPVVSPPAPAMMAIPKIETSHSIKAKTRTGEFDQLEKDFFAREAELYKHDKPDSFDDLE